MIWKMIQKDLERLGKIENDSERFEKTLKKIQNLAIPLILNFRMIQEDLERFRMI